MDGRQILLLLILSISIFISGCISNINYKENITVTNQSQYIEENTVATTNQTESVTKINISETNNTQMAKLNVKNFAIQLQNADPTEIAGSRFDLVIMDYSGDGSEEGKYSKDEINMIKRSGTIPIAYLNIGEAEDYRFYWKNEWNSNPPSWLGSENPDWNGNYAVKYWDDEWRSILHSYLDEIIDQGFSGVFLDKIDEYEYWSSQGILTENESAKRMVELIKDIENYTKNKNKTFYIIPNNGERIIKYDNTVISSVSGWVAESLFYNGIEKWNGSDKEWIINERFPYLDSIVSEGKPVFTIDYVDDGSGYTGINKERIDECRRNSIEKRYIPYIASSDMQLDKLNIIKNVQPN